MLYIPAISLLQRHRKEFIFLQMAKHLKHIVPKENNIPLEARDHVKMFHYYFFTLDPDDKVIQYNITKALYLADVSAKRQYDNLKENGYYSNLICWQYQSAGYCR